MGTLADRVNEFWSPLDFARAIDSQLDALRQEIRDLKGGKPGVRKIKSDPLPEPELQRGDFVSYMDVEVPPHRMMDNKPTRSIKVWGIFHHQNGSDIWAHWQNSIGDFPCYLTFVPRDRVTFEFRPEK